MTINIARNLIFLIFALDFLLIISLSFFDILLLVNLIQHILAIIFFGLLIYLLYKVFYKKKYKDIKGGFINIFLWVIFVFLAFFISQDYYYTLVTPHPFFHDTYFI